MKLKMKTTFKEAWRQSNKTPLIIMVLAAIALLLTGCSTTTFSSCFYEFSNTGSGIANYCKVSVGGKTACYREDMNDKDQISCDFYEKYRELSK